MLVRVLLSVAESALRAVVHQVWPVAILRFRRWVVLRGGPYVLSCVVGSAAFGGLLRVGQR